MDTYIMPEYFQERNVIRNITNRRRRIKYVNNCSGQKNTDYLQCTLESVRLELRYLTPKCTHMIQPCDYFVIQKIKFMIAPVGEVQIGEN